MSYKFNPFTGNFDLAPASGSFIPLSEKGTPLGVATLDGGGKVPVSQLPNSVMEFKGVFDPATATFTDASGNAGDVWQATAAGSYDAGSGSITYAIGDWAVHNGSVFQKSLNSNSVASVNGFTGVVVLDSDDISEGTTNLYFTDARAKTAVVDDAITDGITDKAASQNAVFDALALKANTNLDNLTSPTAIPDGVHLLPANSFQVNLGSDSNFFNIGYIDRLRDLSNIQSIHVSDRLLQDLSGVISFDWENRQVLDATSILSADFKQRRLSDNTGSISVNYNTRQLLTGATAKLDWSGTDVSLNSRKLTNVNDGTSANDAVNKGQLDTKANTTLNNLGTTSINANLLPSVANTRTIGSLSLRFLNIYSNGFSATDSLGGNFTINDNAGNSYGQFTSNLLLPSGVTSSIGITSNTALTGAVAIMTINSAIADSAATKNIHIETGNKTAGTGDSGSITVRTGTSSGGIRGKIKFQDGTQGTVGHVWTQSSADGTGSWQAVGTSYTPKVEFRTISAGEATAKSLTLTNTPAFSSEVILHTVGGTIQFYGDDYTVSGTTLTWNGLGLDGVLANGDKIVIQYNY